jgi:hypothetical protein
MNIDSAFVGSASRMARRLRARTFRQSGETDSAQTRVGGIQSAAPTTVPPRRDAKAITDVFAHPRA